jgi:hypothetical protein
MTKKEREIVEEILYIAENNPAGFIDIDEFEDDDESPDDMTIYNASYIRKLCLELLRKKNEENQ